MGKEPRLHCACLAFSQRYVSLVTLLMVPCMLRYTAALNCTAPILQTCTNCGPGPDCPTALSTDGSILEPGTCVSPCESNSTCTGAWFNYGPGDVAQCDYYDCTQVQQQHRGFTFYRKSCVNDSECLSYELYRYENQASQCTTDLLTGFTTPNECVCVERCLDTQGCRSVTYNNDTHRCELYDCGTSTDGTGYIFWRRECLTACENPMVQTCTNCGPGPDCPANFVEVGPILEPNTCISPCEGNTACKGAWFRYGPGANPECQYYHCSQVQQVASGLTYHRKSCVNDPECQSYQLYRYGDTMPSCTGANTSLEAYTTPTEYDCLGKCLDTQGCRSIHYINTTCWLLSCQTSVDANGHVFWKRECQTACTEPAIQTCTNCGPGPECPEMFARDGQVSLPSTCKSLCEGNTTCTGAWFNYGSGDEARCDYYHCTQVQQQNNGLTYLRKTCTNDTECSSYKLYRYENNKSNCKSDTAPLLPDFITLTDYECVEKCLDTVGCRSLTYRLLTQKCELHHCDTSADVSGNAPGYVFWRRECQTDCTDGTTLQRCINCGPSSTCPAPYANVTQLFPSDACKDMCFNDTECGTSYYNFPNNTCTLHACPQVVMVTGTSSFRKACYNDCSEYEIFELDNMTVNCEPFHTETSGTSGPTCLHHCLDMSDCLAVVYDEQTLACYYFNCTDRVNAGKTTLYWRNCLEACNRIHTQTCYNCRAWSGCNPMVQNTTTYSSYHCIELCTAAEGCRMSVFEPIENTCRLYECSSLQYNVGSVSYRTACNDDCLHYNIEITNTVTMNCPAAIAEDVGGVDFQFCMTRCLDMPGCRAVEHDSNSRSCQYYDCDDVIDTGMTSSVSVMRRICITPEPVRNYTQTCLDCNRHAGLCPDRFEKPDIHISTDCDATCDVTSGCRMACYSNGICSLYDCLIVKEKYGVISYRSTYNTDCLQFKLDTRGRELGTCNIINVTTEYSTSHYCMDGCLDYLGCRGVSYMTGNQTCWFHSCGNSTLATNIGITDDVEFIERQCDLETCEHEYEQVCVNCDIHSSVGVYYSYDNWSQVSLGSNCTDACRWNDSCGAAVYDPTRSRCRFYNHTGLRMEWGKTAVRKSCRSDCPKFKLTQLSQAIGVCNTMTSFSDIPTLDDCLHICLDTTGCFGTTFYDGDLLCTLHDCANNTFVTSNETFTFVYMDCNVEECSKTHRQTCMNCIPGPNCQIAMVLLEQQSLDYMCELTCNLSSNCLASYFDMPYSQCSTYNCGQVQGYQRYHRLYRKSCTSDCPVFEIYTTSNRTGVGCTDIGDSGEDDIPSIYYCIEACLDLANCRATTYSQRDRKCTYHSNCTGSQTTLDFVMAWRECVEEDSPPGTLIQTCVNCGKGPDCPTYIDSVDTVYFDYECETACSNSTDCRALQYNTAYSNCYLYQCGQVEQSIGQTVYRRTDNADCLEFELFTFDGYRGTCDSLGDVTGVHSAEYCMELCLEIPGCRGISYSELHEMCTFHACDGYSENPFYTYIKRLCSDDFEVCNKTEVQTCVNCRKGPTCQFRFDAKTNKQPRTLTTTAIGVDTDLLQIWRDTVPGVPACANSLDQDQAPQNMGPDLRSKLFAARYRADMSSSRKVYCSEVNLQVGNTVYRATCSQDCPKFEIFIHTGVAGNCNNAISDLAGGITLHYCISKCLDMNGCRTINYNNVNKSCEFYTACDEFTRHENVTLFRRSCINESLECSPDTIQTCLNCGMSSICPAAFAEPGSQYFTGNCYDLKLSLNDSDAVHYLTSDDQCMAYQCSFIDFAVNQLVYRNSCDADCTRFELFQKNNYEGVCDTIGSDSGGINLQYCVKRCLDLTGCRGVTFYGSSLSCTYHSCSNTSDYTSDLNTTFVERKCVSQDCERNYTHICLNCATGSSCQGDFGNIPSQSTWEDCYNATRSLQNLEHAGLLYYSEKTGQCRTYNCTLVFRAEESIVLRKSCTPDCPIYRIANLYGYISTCPVIGWDEGGVDQEYCTSKCLDMTGCRAVSFTSMNSGKCLYHSCTDKEPNYQYYITWRVCVNDTEQNVLYPERPYKQKCLSCDTDCWRDIASDSPITRHSECDVTCPGCKSVLYNPLTETCTQAGCDRIYAPVGSSVLYRTTDNPDCLEYEVFFSTGRQPLCNVIGYEEGFGDRLHCLERCLDIPGCRSVTDDFGTNCTFYDCTNTTTAPYNYYMEKVCSTDTSHLLKIPTNCSSPNYQICVNCAIDSTHCQSDFSSELISRSVCESECTLIDDCETVAYSSGTCTMYQCSVVTPTDTADTMFYHKICFDDDCPMYEIHRLEHHFGVCDVIRTEHLQFYPGICFERCLRMPGCRAITFWGRFNQCLYHSCDCSYSYVDPYGTDTVFMWRYCLANISTSSIGSNETSPPKLFPDCLSTTTTTSTSTTTTTLTTTTTTPTTTTTTTLSTTSSQTPLSSIQSTTASIVTPGSNSTTVTQGPPAASTSAGPTAATSSTGSPVASSSAGPPAASSSTGPQTASSAGLPTPPSSSSGPSSPSSSSLGPPTPSSSSSGPSSPSPSSSGPPAPSTSSAGQPTPSSSSAGLPTPSSSSSGPSSPSPFSPGPPTPSPSSSGLQTHSSSSAGQPTPSSSSAGLPTPSSSSSAPPTQSSSSPGPPTPSSSSAGLPTPSSSSAGLPTPSSSSAGLPTPSSSSAGLPTLSSSSAGLPTPSSSSTGLPTLSSSSAGLPTPSSSSAGLPTPSLSSAGLPTLSSSSAGLPTPSSSSAGLPTPSSSSAGLPTPSSSSAGLPTPSSSSAGLPTLSSSSAGLPTPSSSSTGLPTLSSSSAGLPTPSSSSAGLPTPSLSSAGLPTLSSSSAGLPTPSSSSAGLPTPSSSSAGLPTPSSSSAGLPTPSSSSAGPPTPSSSTVNTGNTSSTQGTNFLPVNVTLNPVTPNLANSTSDSQPNRIYLRSCLCSKGLFGNLTVEEVSAQLVKNLTINKDETGAARRRRYSASDDRPSAITVGTVGVGVLAFEFSTLLIMDSSRIVQTFKMIGMALNGLRPP